MPRFPSRAVFRAALVLALAGCDGSPTSPRNEAVFLIRACFGSEHAPGGELYRVLLRDGGRIAEAQSLIGDGPVRIVGGELSRGDGGFNSPWSWHLEPATVVFSEGAIELCDGCPSFIEADPSYWLDTVGSYCPIGEVLRRES